MRVLLLCIFIIFTQCSKRVTDSKHSTIPDWNAINKIIEAEIGSNTQILNESKSHVLAVHSKTPTETMNHYLIIDVTTTATIVKKGSFNPGYIKWRDNTSLELLNVPGMIPAGKDLSDYIEIIQLPSNK
jgi:hypothetical protein